MTSRRLKPADLPGWPRLLMTELAAAYVGQSVDEFVVDVGTMWPQPVVGMRRKVWDRLALDQVADRANPQIGVDLDATREARRLAYEAEQQQTADRRKAKDTPSPPQKRPEMFSPKTLGEWWSCSPRLIQRLCKAGKLRHFIYGRMIRIPAAAVDEFEQAGGTKNV